MKTKEEIVEIILNNLCVYFESDEDFGPVAHACADAILADDHEDNEDETITCDLCGKVELEHEAIQGGWIPSYWKGDDCQLNPVCDDCVKERITEIDGDNVLIEPASEQGLDEAVRAVVNGEQ